MRLISIKTLLFSAALFSLAACSGFRSEEYDGIGYKGQLNDPIMVITLLSEQQREWKGTPYVLGGDTRSGVDCSGFTRVTFMDRFNIKLPRTTTEQVKYGKKVPKSQIQTGDLVFFKTGRGPNGYHVGIYVKNGQFLHASTKGGVIYSSLYNAYWDKVFWQVRRI